MSADCAVLRPMWPVDLRWVFGQRPDTYSDLPLLYVCPERSEASLTLVFHTSAKLDANTRYRSGCPNVRFIIAVEKNRKSNHRRFRHVFFVHPVADCGLELACSSDRAVSSSLSQSSLIVISRRSLCSSFHVHTSSSLSGRFGIDIHCTEADIYSFAVFGFEKPSTQKVILINSESLPKQFGCTL